MKTKLEINPDLPNTLNVFAFTLSAWMNGTKKALEVANEANNTEIELALTVEQFNILCSRDLDILARVVTDIIKMNNQGEIPKDFLNEEQNVQMIMDRISHELNGIIERTMLMLVANTFAPHVLLRDKTMDGAMAFLQNFSAE